MNRPMTAPQAIWSRVKRGLRAPSPLRRRFFTTQNAPKATAAVPKRTNSSQSGLITSSRSFASTNELPHMTVAATIRSL